MDWTPADNEHASTIYYIAGTMLNTMDNLTKRKENDTENDERENNMVL